MDKFGIFELLDTLSQIATETTESETPPPEPSAQRPSPDDKSFLPPDFGGEQATSEQKMQRNAINSLYSRHEDISKRIDKNK